MVPLKAFPSVPFFSLVIINTQLQNNFACIPLRYLLFYLYRDPKAVKYALLDKSFFLKPNKTLLSYLA